MIIRTKIYDITNVLKNSNSKLIKKSIEQGNKIYAIRLEKFSGLLGYELLPNRRIGTELADVAKRFGFKGIIHSDELPAYGLTEQDVHNIRENLDCFRDCAFLFIISKDRKKAELALIEIVNRINDMLNGVPKDTRQAKDDGTTMFLRPQPGSARMYPETDHPLINIKKYRRDWEKYTEISYRIKIKDEIDEKFTVVRLKNKDPKLYLELKKKFKDTLILDSLDPEFRRKVLEYMGLDKNKIEHVLWSDYIDVFEEYYDKVKLSIIYYVIFQLKGEVKREFGEDVNINKDFIIQALDLLSRNVITRYALIKLLYYYNKNNKPLSVLVDELNLRKLSYDEVLKKIKVIIEEKRLDKSNKKLLIRQIMNELRYIAEPSDILKAIEEVLRQ